jgi:hypothetical protein
VRQVGEGKLLGISWIGCNLVVSVHIHSQAIALNAGLMEVSSPLTSAAGLGGLNR